MHNMLLAGRTGEMEQPAQAPSDPLAAAAAAAAPSKIPLPAPLTSKLNPKATEFKFNPKAADFKMSSPAVPAAAAPSAASQPRTSAFSRCVIVSQPRLGPG